MRKSIISLLAFYLIVSGKFINAAEVSFEDEDQQVIKIIETAVFLGKQYHDSIWPGYNLNEIPLIIYRVDKYALLVNAPEAVDGFLKYPENWPPLLTEVQYYLGQYQDLVGQLSFDYAINNFKATAIAYVDQPVQSFVEFLIHENFHQFQRDNFGEIPWAREELYPIEDAPNLALASIEVQLLTDIIKQSRVISSKEICPLVAEFVALRNFRWRTTPSFIARYEQGQEINEGTAKYVEMKGMSFLPGLKMPYKSDLNLDSLDFAKALINNFDFIMEDGIVKIENISRNRIYPVGASEGYLLDRLGADWKSLAQKAGEEFRFDKVLAEACEFDSSRAESYVEKAKNDYDYEQLLKLATEKIEKYKNSFDSAFTEFNKQPGHKVILKLSGRNLSRSRESIAKKWIIENGSKELRDHYKIYFLKSNDNLKLTFQLNNSGLMESTNWNNRNKSLEFFCQNLESLALDGKVCELIKNMERKFNSIKLSANNFDFETEKPGMISITDNLIVINLLP